MSRLIRQSRNIQHLDSAVYGAGFKWHRTDGFLVAKHISGVVLEAHVDTITIARTWDFVPGAPQTARAAQITLTRHQVRPENLSSCGDVDVVEHKAGGQLDSQMARTLTLLFRQRWQLGLGFPVFGIIAEGICKPAMTDILFWFLPDLGIINVKLACRGQYRMRESRKGTKQINNSVDDDTELAPKPGWSPAKIHQGLWDDSFNCPLEL